MRCPHRLRRGPARSSGAIASTVSAGSPTLQAQVVIAIGVVLIVGAWRHLGAVLATPDAATSDPGVLARLTRVPRVVWNATFVIVLAGSTWVAGRAVLDAAGILG